MGANNTCDVEKGFIFNQDDRRNPATKGSAKRNRPYISFVILRSVQETVQSARDFCEEFFPRG